MNAEWTNIKELGHVRGWLLYDGACPVCCRWADRWEPILTRRGFDLAPLQAPWVEECLDIHPTSSSMTALGHEADDSLERTDNCRDGGCSTGGPGEMLLVTRDGRCLGGADAAVALARTIWWAWPVFLLAQLPFVLPVMRTVYRRLAARRYSFSMPRRFSLKRAPWIH